MKEIINTYFSGISRLGIILVILTAFFLFTNLTTEFYDTAKFLTLVFFTGILLLLLTLKFTLTNKVVLNRTPLDLPLLLLLVVAIISTVLSGSPYVAILGNQLKIHSSLAALVTYVLFYFVLVNSLKSVKDVKLILNLTTFFAGLLSIVTLLSYFGLKVLPFPWTQIVNFTPTGSSFSTTAILVMLLPVCISQIFSANFTTKLVNVLLLTLMGVTIALTGTLSTWIAACFGFILTVLVIVPVDQISKIRPVSLISLAVPVVIVALTLLLSFVPFNDQLKTLFYNPARNFPREIQIPFVVSWKVAVSSFRDHPFWGSGPGTFSFDFTSYKPIEMNASKSWNLRFDSAYNEYLQILATLGGVGFLALFSLTALFVSSAYKTIRSHLPGENQVEPGAHLGGVRGEKLSLAISGLTFFVILLLHPSTLVLWVFGLIILAAFYINNSQDKDLAGLNEADLLGQNINKFLPREVKQVLLRIAGNSSLDSSTQTIRVDALPSILLVICATLILISFFFAGKFAIADYHHRLAFNAISQNQGVVAYNELIASEKLNPYSDLYRTDLAQVNFALANAIALSKGPTEASPAGSLTDQDKQNISVLLQQSINEGRTATSLSPRSSINWEILALLYRQIAGVAQNALVFSLDSYGRAIFQDPLNPLLRLNVGGTYYAIKNYDLAIRFFTDSINLKPDFANGYYNLSVALRDKGDLNTALQAAEKVVQLVEKSSPDYKIATDYLNDLKNKINPPTPEQPPAATTSGALQNEELPKVVDVGNPPEKIATPPAIKKPSSTPQPSPNQ